MRSAAIAAPDRPGILDPYIRVVGSLAVQCEGRVLSTTDVGSRKARTLLALLAVEHGRLVGTDRIIDVLWGDSPPRRPAENLATLVSRLRTSLGPEVVLGGRGGYRLGGALDVDLTRGERLVAQADHQLTDGESARSLATARHALEVLDGEVLQEERDADWVAPARAVHRELVRHARHTGAEAAEHARDLPTALTLARAAVAADPLDEAAYRSLMRAYALAGEPARALSAYDELRSTLATELGVDPARATRELHVAILQDRLPGPAHVLPVAAPRSGSCLAAVAAATAPPAGTAPRACKAVPAGEAVPAGTAALAGTPTLVMTGGPALMLVVGATGAGSAGAAGGPGTAGVPGTAGAEVLEHQVAELIRFARSMGCVVVHAPPHSWSRLLRTS